MGRIILRVESRSVVMGEFQNAFNQLLGLAPGPVFPRARQLYLRKYCLEGREAVGRFRTFLLEEEIQESNEGVVRVRALAFAVVHWQAAQLPLASYSAYLAEQWQIEPQQLLLVEAEWFRQGGAYARFTAPAVFERSSSGELLMADG